MSSAVRTGDKAQCLHEWTWGVRKSTGARGDEQKGEYYPIWRDRGWSAWGSVQWERPRDWMLTALLMMVIDAGTIQTPQTPQQIKRLFCKVVKEQNGKGEQWDPSLAHAHLLCSVTPSASVCLVSLVSSVPQGGELLRAFPFHSCWIHRQCRLCTYGSVYECVNRG